MISYRHHQIEILPTGLKGFIHKKHFSSDALCWLNGRTPKVKRGKSGEKQQQEGHKNSEASQQIKNMLHTKRK